MPQAPSFFEEIDWPLLRQQKQTLIELRDKNNRACLLTHSECLALDGIVHLIDGLQDDAHSLGYLDT